MVQTRRARRVSTAPLLQLPAEILRKIASTSVSPGLVVAAGQNVEARTALRKGTDEAERSRFGGIGVTVREAEHILRTRYGAYTDEAWLASRAAAGRALCRKNLLRWADRDKDMDHPDFPEREEDLRWEFSEREPGNTDSVFYFEEVGVFFATGWCKMMIAYGADLDAQNAGGYTPLHYLAAYAPPIALASDLARLLIGAGNDIDAHCLSYHEDRGPTPLCWCLTAHPCQLGGPVDAHYELATSLIEQGCDVGLAHHGYLRMGAAYPRDDDCPWPYPEPLLHVVKRRGLHQADQTPEVHGRFMAFFREKLEAAGLELDSNGVEMVSDSESDSGSASD